MKDKELRSRSRFFGGVVALTLGNLFVKVVGLVLKIPLHGILGDAGMVYYNNAYDIYAWLFTIATTGLPTAISMLISEDRVHGNFREIKKIFRVTLGLFIIIGILGSAIMFFGAPFFERAYKITDSRFCMMAVAPTLFFICVASALRGYFQGFQHMVPTAVSEVIEATGKLALGLLFAGYAVKQGYALHIVAAYAALGLTVGVACGMIYLIATKLLFRPETFEAAVSDSPEDVGRVRGTKKIAFTLMAIAIPITLSSSVQSFSAVIDGMVLSNRLQSAGFSEQATAEMIGNYKTLASPLCNLPPAFIAPVTASIIPLMAASIASGNKKKTRQIMNGALMLTAIIELPCALGMSALSEPILKLLFGDTASSETAAPLLSLLSLAVFFVSLISMTSAFLQAHKFERKPIISMLIGAAVKLISIYIFAAIPEINIYASPISSFLGSFAISAANLYFMKKHIGFVPDFGKMLIRPFASALICALTALLSFGFLRGIVGRNIALFAAIAVAVVVYFFVIFLFRALTREDVMLLPKGAKLCSVLERMHLLKKEE